MSDSDSSKFIVLAAVDLDSGSTLVMERAIELAASHPRGVVHVVKVAGPAVPPALHAGVIPIDTPPPSPAALSEFCDETAQRLLKQEPLQHLPSIQVHVVVGTAAEEIVWMAAHLDADFIVLSTHGRTGLKRLLLGSVAEKVVRLAGCPVVVVREKLHGAEWRIPEIEPVCPECAVKRAETGGRQLWCARHSEHHVRGHVQNYTTRGEEAPHAWGSSTGT